MYKISLNIDKLAAYAKSIKDKSAPALAFFANHLTQKLMILAGLSIFCAVLLTPQIQFRYPEYTTGSIATSNIKADRDFLVEKKDATEQKKMAAFHEIPSVYDFDSEVLARIQNNLVNAFARTKDNGSDKTTLASREGKLAFQQIKKDFEGALGLSLSEEEFVILQQHKFSPLIAKRISQLITAAYQKGLITNITFMQQEKDKGILVRDIRNQGETEMRNLSEILHISAVQANLIKIADQVVDLGRSDIRRVTLGLAVKLLQPNLIYNKQATELKKEEALKDVKPVFFKVLKNEMIVREGEKITAPSLDKLEAYYRIKGEKRLSKLLIFMGMFFIVAFLSIILYFPAKQWLKTANLDLLFLAVTALLQIIIVKAGIFIAQALSEAFPMLNEEAFIYPIPFTAAAMLVSLLINRNLALIQAIFLSVLVTFLFEGKVSLFLFAFLGSAVASYLIIDCRKRTAFFRIGFLLGLVNAATILFFGLLQENIFTWHTVISVFMGLLGGIVASVLVSGLCPIFESLFHYMTDIKLLELANLNQPIFQQMIMETPGTYSHSVIVASMVETAAETIGANSLLTKVSAYYHDMGKMKKPQYFIENQPHGENKHDNISPKMSSLVIISHVKDGCDLAKKIKLGKEITDIIREHHGTSLVSFFYEKAKKDKDPSIRSLPETDFRYPGPKPQTREAGLVLLGDVVEASSRSLSNPTPSRIKTLVRERLERVLSDGQLDECGLTLHDLNKIAESFTMILNGIFHHRIDYPEPVIRETNGTRKENGNGTFDRKQAEKNKGRAEAAAALGE